MLTLSCLRNRVTAIPNEQSGTSRININAFANGMAGKQVLIQFDTTNLTSDLSKATFAIIPDTYRVQQISFINSISADLGE
ncbi:hypothetical protein BD310DRAFT_937395 [Dichomitus squalens]|uniref:Uncharacterized protein n=1 Tax=Dichomitus squalens TaxID=114155 RepID=A0A4Q9PFE0_9APHY|nr:hypothetical protein BD310DRAFT_937395 [Dichomitus squalens]